MFNSMKSANRKGDEKGAERERPAGFRALAASGRRFGRDERGSVAIIFGLTAGVILALVGGAIDYGRAVTARDQIQKAVDASVLAAARVWQITNDMNTAEAHGLEYYDKNKPHAMASGVSGFSPDYVRNAIVMEASAVIQTPFLSLVLPEGYTVNARAEAQLAVGGNAETSLEIAMMLDVTGSMAGSKIENLKEAAKDLVDIVVWDDQRQYTSKIALVPFADAVNLGSTTLVDQVRGTVKSGSCSSSTAPCTYVNSNPTSSQWTWGVPATWFSWTRASGSTTRSKVSQYCVTERVGNNKYSDVAPTSAADRVGPWYSSTSTSSSELCGIVNTGDLEVNSVQPLINDRTALKRRIDKLTVGGPTSGHLGTAWAWYMLSPNWAYLWPNASRPVAYHTDKVQKIAILMTDGEYNSAYCRGVLANDSGSGSNSQQISCNASNAVSNSQAQQVCSAMKNGTGITVYTIGFDLGGNQTAINTLRNCASDQSKFYDAADGDALRQAFRDIALQIAKLRLSQ